MASLTTKVDNKNESEKAGIIVPRQPLAFAKNSLERELEQEILRKLDWHLLPVLTLLFL